MTLLLAILDLASVGAISTAISSPFFAPSTGSAIHSLDPGVAATEIA
jgi:hypothetical protein